MHVVATAGHVDHGKSTLVRALTGMEPDRFAEEQRRGMTIDLGFAWTELPTGQTVAFVDVPGHERFVPTMLAGVGPVPAALMVVAADEGWMPQSAEHLDALDALGVRHGLLVITRSDLMEPELALEDAREHLVGTSMADVDAVCVSAVTGAGLPELRGALGGLVDSLPAPEPRADVRLWIDRAFTIRGAGTVVTGTLTEGTIRVDDELELVTGDAGRPLRCTVRALQCLGEPEQRVAAVARVAVNLRGVPLERLHRGDALVTPGRWRATDVVDVRLGSTPGPARIVEAAGAARTAGAAGVAGAVGAVGVAELPTHAVLHLGAAAVTARVRPLGADTARLTLERALPLRIGDRAVLRDPGARRIPCGLTVLDTLPDELRRRGAAAARAQVLETLDGVPDGAAELARRGMIRHSELLAMGAKPPSTAARRGDWLLDRGAISALAARLARVVADHAVEHPLEDGLPLEAARRAVGLPEVRLLEVLLADPAAATVTTRDGRVHHGLTRTELPAALRPAVDTLRAQLDVDPFAAPEAHHLSGLGLGPKQLAAAARAGELLRVGDGVWLLPGAPQRAARVLATLPRRFTLSDARQALRTSRRVAVPLMELLAREGVTRRHEDGTHELLHG